MNRTAQHQVYEIRRTTCAIVALCLCLIVSIGLTKPSQAASVEIVTAKSGISQPTREEAVKNAIQVISSKHQMDSQELAAVLQDFDDMRRTESRNAAAFVVRAATPERIDRLYQIPEVALIPKILRENGLIFAGLPGSKLLTFKKPSEIISKVSSWFPDEITSSRAKNNLWGGDIGLQGPFDNWETEPATFMAMWNCTPRIVWLQPDRSPFKMTRASSGLEFWLLGRSSSPSGEDFGVCVREDNGYGSGATLGDSIKRKESTYAIAERVVPNLQAKFSNFLKANRCSGTGPDDCVLILHLWASLAANDPALAAMLQALEADIALDSPLPAMKRPFDTYSPRFDAGSDRFDELWRRAAFLRAKLVSILAGPNGWPTDALNQSIRQLIALQQLLETPYAHRFYYNDMNYRAEAISPWLVLYSELRKPNQDEQGIPAVLLRWKEQPRDSVTLKRIQTAVINELSKQEKGDCHIFKPWLTPELKGEYVLNHLSHFGGILPQCVSPDWRWMVVGDSKEAASLRAQYLNLIPTATDLTREVLLSNLSNNGDDCFGVREKLQDEWQRKMCKTWIQEPVNTSTTLKNSKLTLDKSHQFKKLIYEAPKAADSEEIKESQEDWLSSLTQGMGAEVSEKMKAYAANLHHQHQLVRSVILWRHPGHRRALAEIELADNESTKAYLTLAPHSLQQIEIPTRLKWKGDNQKIARVSDLDEDGKLEIWWAESFDACQGEDADIERELDCSAKSANMGEISGDVLSFFIKNSTKIAPVDEIWTSKGNVYPLPLAAKIDSGTFREPCNRLLIGSILSKELAINFGESKFERGDVIDLACKEHPVSSKQTIVTLFHDIPDQPQANDISKKGFVIAVIDVQRRKILSVYRESIEEDASMRIDEGSLELDTARYYITPKLRAFGVRMNIGYSPRYAEGGENNYLWLFIEEGKLLRPILKNMAMSKWTMVGDGAQCFDNPDVDCKIEYEKTSLALAPTLTNGWRDLEVITTTSNGTTASKWASKVMGRLRAKNKMYH